MARMKFQELTTQSPEALRTQLAEQQVRLEQLRFGVADGTNKKVRELRTVRQHIARLMTALKQMSHRPAPVTTVLPKTK